MGKPLLKMGSITFAIKARDILNRNGFKTKVVKTPRKNKTEGCSYSLIVEKDIDIAQAILQKYGMKVLEIIYEGDVK